MQSLLDVFDITVLNSLDQGYLATNDVGQDLSARENAVPGIAVVEKNADNECSSSTDASSGSSAATTVAKSPCCSPSPSASRQDDLSLFAPDTTLGEPSTTSHHSEASSSLSSSSPSSSSSSSAFSSFTNPSSLSSSRITSGVQLLTPTCSLRDLNTPPFPQPDREDVDGNRGPDAMRLEHRHEANSKDVKDDKQVLASRCTQSLVGGQRKRC